MQRRLGPRRNGFVHPVTRAAFPDTGKEHALDFKFPPDERIQIYAARNDIAPRAPRRFTVYRQLAANIIKNFCRKESDLPRVVFLETKETVAEQPLPRHTLNFLQLHRWMVAGRLIVMAEEIMPRRDEELLDFDVWRVGHCGARVAESEEHRNN